MYEGIRTYENGRKEEEEFETYEALLKWLAEDLDAGMSATIDGNPIPQGPLTDDVQAYMNASISSIRVAA